MVQAHTHTRAPCARVQAATLLRLEQFCELFNFADHVVPIFHNIISEAYFSVDLRTMLSISSHFFSQRHPLPGLWEHYIPQILYTQGSHETCA